MTKPLLKLCLILIIATATLAIITNLQSASIEPLKQQSLGAVVTDKVQFNWLQALTAHPQFTPEMRASSEPVQEEKVITISDGQLVGIVADQPYSALINVPNKANSLSQLTVGESWLEGWEIKRILPDSVVWKQSKTNIEHTQFLFEASNNQAIESKNQ